MATEIKSICAAGGVGYAVVYGLGDDNKVYWWDSYTNRWELFGT